MKEPPCKKAPVKVKSELRYVKSWKLGEGDERFANRKDRWFWLFAVSQERYTLLSIQAKLLYKRAVSPVSSGLMPCPTFERVLSPISSLDILWHVFLVFTVYYSIIWSIFEVVMPCSELLKVMAERENSGQIFVSGLKVPPYRATAPSATLSRILLPSNQPKSAPCKHDVLGPEIQMLRSVCKSINAMTL